MDIVERKMVGVFQAAEKKTRSTAGRATMPSNLGFSYLLIFNVDLEKWCARYELKPFWGKCSACGSELYADQPFVSVKKRGLIATPCSCGSRNTPFSYIDLGYDEVNLNYLAMGTSIGTSKAQASQGKIGKARPKLKLVDSSHR